MPIQADQRGNPQNQIPMGNDMTQMQQATFTTNTSMRITAAPFVPRSHPTLQQQAQQQQTKHEAQPQTQQATFTVNPSLRITALPFIPSSHQDLQQQEQQQQQAEQEAQYMMPQVMRPNTQMVSSQNCKTERFEKS